MADKGPVNDRLFFCTGARERFMLEELYHLTVSILFT